MTHEVLFIGCLVSTGKLSHEAQKIDAGKVGEVRIWGLMSAAAMEASSEAGVEILEAER